MKVFGVGIDIVETARIRESVERFGDKFVERVFTAEESRYCRACRYPEQRFAARFAAKEAVAKAFGTGIGDVVSWLEVEVERAENGAPSIRLHGGAARFAEAQQIGQVQVSLTHTEAYAAASVVAVCPD